MSGGAPTPRQQATRALLQSAGIVPVLTAHTIEQSVEAARALARGGLTAVEVTLRSQIALDALEAIQRAVPELRVGAGTVRSPAQAREAQARGAHFVVTPGTPPALAAALAALNLPALPGAASATEILALMDLGFDAVKLFPAAALGGLATIRSLAGPFPELALCPTGGIGEADALDYLRQPNVLCIGGSWMVSADWLAGGRYDAIEASARRARALVAARAAPSGRGT